MGSLTKRWYYQYRMNPQLLCDGTPGLNLSFILQAQDNSNVDQPATGTASIDKYSLAYLADAGGNAFQIVPKVTMAPGEATQTVTATFSLNDSASGKPLPVFTQACDLVAPPIPQKAVKIVETAGPGAGSGSDLADPGSASIPVSLS